MSRIYARFRSHLLPGMLKLLLLGGMLGTFLPQQPAAQANAALPAAASATHVPVLLLHGMEGAGQANCYNSFNPPDSWSRWDGFMKINNLNTPGFSWDRSLIHALQYYYVKGDLGCDNDIGTDYSECNGYYESNTDANVGTNNEDIRHIACRFYWYVYNTYTKNGIPVNILAHSMGGIIAKWALSEAAQHNSATFPYPLLVYNVVTLSTPFQGVPDNIFGQANQISANLACGGCFEAQQLEVGPNSPNSIIWQLNNYSSTEGDWTVIGSHGNPPPAVIALLAPLLGPVLLQALTSACDIVNVSSQFGHSDSVVSPGPSLASAQIIDYDQCIFHEEPEPGEFDTGSAIVPTPGSTSYQDDASTSLDYSGYDGIVGNGGIFNSNGFNHTGNLPHPLAAAIVALGITRGPDSYPPSPFPIYDVNGGGAFYTVWAATGGLAGPLGLATSSWYTVTGGEAQDFQGGSIYWSSATGTYEVQGSIHAEYVTVQGGPGGPLGFPSSDELAFNNSSGTAIGRVSYFYGNLCGARGPYNSGAAIYYSGTTGAHQVGGCIYNKYWQMGEANSFLGFPIGDVTAISGGYVSNFQGTSCGTGGGGGAIFASSPGVYEVHGCIYQEYIAVQGGPGGPLGFPSSDELPFNNSSGTAIGRVSYFYGNLCGSRGPNNSGSAIYHNGASTHQVGGCIYNKYWNLGQANSFLGFPTSDVTTIGGGYVSYFQGTSCGTGGGGGAIFHSSTTNSHEVHGCIYQEYMAVQGGPTGVLGFPTTDQQSIAGGYVSYFYGNLCGSRGPNNSGSAIYNNGGSSTHQVGGCIYNKYWNMGGPNGPLGFPTSDVTAPGGGYVSYFAGQVCSGGAPNGSGSAIYSYSSGTFEVQGCVYHVYTSVMGGPGGALGWPTSDEHSVTSGYSGAAGRANTFQHGIVIWWANGNGTYEVQGSIYSAYLGQQAALGFPISNEYTNGLGNRESDFENGLIQYNPSTHQTTVTVYPPCC
jgi:uncharacterized protein with LGFP repeats